MSSVTPHLLRGLLARVFSISRRTWIFLAATLVLLMALVIWTTISAASWLLGIARDGVNAAPDAVRAASSQVEQVIPGIQEKLALLLPALTPEAQPREVSGTDPGPVARFPGLARVQWQRDDQETRVRYEGKVDFTHLLEHYVQGFTVQGYRHRLLSASTAEERHEFIKDGGQFAFVFSRRESDVVTVDLSVREHGKTDRQTESGATPGASS